MHDLCSTYPGARGPVSREIVVPPSRERRLGPTWAAEGPARKCQQAPVSAEAEDLRLRCADMRAEAAMAREQVAPLAVRVKELEEEVTRVASERDALLSRVEEAMVSTKSVAAQLGETKGTLDEALKAAEASWVDALDWKGKFEGKFCSLYFVYFSCARPPNSLVWYRAGEGGLQGDRGVMGRGPALEREIRG